MTEKEPKESKETKFVWVNPYEGEPLPLAFRTREQCAELLSPEEIAAITGIGMGIVFTKELGKKVEDLLWEDL